MDIEPAQDQDDAASATLAAGHLTLCGTMVADPHLILLLGTAAWLCRAVYNAAIDPHVTFPEAVLHALEASRARRDGREPPPAPPRSERPIHGAREGALNRELTKLIPLIPEMEGFGRSMLDEAVREACEAVAENRVRRSRARKDGTKQPTLHRRRASDDWTVTTSDFKLHRIGDGEPQERQKPDRWTTGVTLRNRRYRQEGRTEREAAWAAEKRRCGWSEGKVAAGLARRAARQGRDRRRNETRQAFHEDAARAATVRRREAREAERAAAEAEGRAVRRLPPDAVRRDSPRATVGERRMKVDVLGFGYRRVDLGREIPAGAKSVRVQILKPAWRGAKVEVRLVVTAAAVAPKRDEDALRGALQAVAASLPADATPERAMQAARAAGITCRGIDLGVGAPFCDDRGAKTRPVRLARRDWHAMRDAQAAMTHKEECRRHGGVRPAKGEGRAHLARPKPPEGGVGERGGGGPRSKGARRALDAVRRLSARAANRSHTRACQDARAAMADEPMLVATDPRRMVGPLYAKGGPVEVKARRARARKGEAAEGVEALFPPVAETAHPGLPRWFTPERQRALRRNLHATRFALRIDRLRALTLGLGSVLVTPPHEGTTATCPRCLRHEPKPLSRRWHSCPCGLEMPRDQASAIVILGRAILTFRDGPDPGGARAARLEGERQGRERRERRRKAMTAGAERAREGRAASAADAAGTALATPGRGAPGPSARGERKRVRGQGRNVGRGPSRA